MNPQKRHSKRSDFPVDPEITNYKPRLLNKLMKRNGRTKRLKFFVSHTVDKNGFRVAKPLSQRDRLEIYRHHHRQRKYAEREGFEKAFLQFEH